MDREGGAPAMTKRRRWAWIFMHLGAVAARGAATSLSCPRYACQAERYASVAGLVASRHFVLDTRTALAPRLLLHWHGSVHMGCCVDIRRDEQGRHTRPVN